MAAQDYVAVVQQLYVSYFGRPADYYGLQSFEAQLDALKAPTTFEELNAKVQADKAGTSALSKLVNSFNASAESAALYGTDNSTIGLSKFVAAIYTNVLGREADVEGLTFWVNEIAAGRLTRANAAMAITDGALNNTSEQGLKDAVTVGNKLTVATHFTDALDTVKEINGFAGDAAAKVARDMLAQVTDTTDVPAFQATIDQTVQAVADGSVPPQNKALTTGVDTFVGGAGNDVITAIVSNVATDNATLTALDSIDGGAGSDTLKISDLAGNQGIPSSATIKNVEIIEVASAGVAKADTTAANISGVKQVNIVQGTSANVKAGDTTAVSVTGVTGAATVSGGASQTVAATGGVTLDGSVGAVVATDSAQGAANSTIKDGTTVSLTTAVKLDGTAVTGANLAINHATNSTVTVGATGHTASGAVAVVENITGDKAANATAGDITVNGGTTITVTQNATQAIVTPSTTAGATTVNFSATQAAVAVNGSAATTTVVVNQTAAVTKKDSVTAKAEVAESSSVKFGAMKANDTIAIDGLTFKATKDLTAAQAAAAFANLLKTSPQGTAPISNGVYSGTFGGNWTTGAVNGDTVVFTNTNSGDQTDLNPTFVGTGTAPVPTKIADGVVGVDAVTGVGGIAAGAVTVKDVAYNTSTNTITDVTLNAYGTGSLIQSDALAKLSLANAKDATVNVDNHTAAALDLTLNKVTATTAGVSSALNLDHVAAGKYTSLAVHTTGADSAVNVTAAGVTALTIDGSNAVNLTGSTFTALKTVTVSGAAGVTANFAGTNVTDVNASATSGAVTVSIDGSKATYEGGSGADTVTLTSTTVSKAITLGAGNDTLVLASGTTSLTSTVDGGAGTDILKMDALDAAGATTSAAFATKVVGFEKLSVGASSAANVVDLANLNNINYVISANSTAAAAATQEKQTLDFTAVTQTDGNITVGGVTVAILAADTAAQVAGKVAAALNGATLTAPASTGAVTAVATGSTVLVTFPGTAGDVTSVVVANGSSTLTGAVGNTETTKGVLATAAGSLTLKNMVDAGTLELTAGGVGAIVTMKDATGSADTFNIVTKLSTANTSYGTVDVAGVETVNLTVTDTKPATADGGIQTASLTIKDAALKALTVTGNANLTLTQDAGNIALTKVDASALTGKLIAATVVNGGAQTLIGGSAADQLTANHASDVLQGGAGNDILIVNADLVTLTGGAGADLFNVGFATSNSNAYATITDLTAGDQLLLANTAATFASSKVTLGDTAVFQDFANAAVKQTDTGDVSWFQYGGNTYVIENVSNSTSFVNGQDIVVKVTGSVDLSTASFSSGSHVLIVG